MEVEREEALLARELKYVEEMEKNAKKAEGERRRQMKNVLAPSSSINAWIQVADPHV